MRRALFPSPSIRSCALSCRASSRACFRACGADASLAVCRLLCGRRSDHYSGHCSGRRPDRHNTHAEDTGLAAAEDNDCAPSPRYMELAGRYYLAVGLVRLEDSPGMDLVLWR